MTFRVITDDLIQATKSEDPYARLGVALLTDVAVELVEILSRDKDVRIRGTIAHNYTTPPEILRNLAHDSSHKVLYEVAHNPETPADALEHLAKTYPNDFEVMSGVCSNRNTPLPVLLEVANTKKTSLRSYLASNPKLPADVLTKFANSKLTWVTSAVLRNPNTPDEVLLKLLHKDAKNYSHLPPRFSYPPQIWAGLLKYKQSEAYSQALTNLTEAPDEEFFALCEYVLDETVNIRELPRTWLIKLIIDETSNNK